MAFRAGEDSAVLDGFLRSRDDAVRAVRDWVGRVVRGGWRLADPEAVIQDAMLELVRFGREGRIRRDRSFRAFAMTVARNNCIDAYRKERLRQRHDGGSVGDEPEAGPGADPDERLRDRERWEQLRFVIQSLTPPCRELLAMAFGDGMSAPEIGERLGLTAGNVRVRTHRCLKSARAVRTRWFPARGDGRAEP